MYVPSEQEEELAKEDYPFRKVFPFHLPFRWKWQICLISRRWICPIEANSLHCKCGKSMQLCTVNKFSKGKNPSDFFRLFLPSLVFFRFSQRAFLKKSLLVNSTHVDPGGIFFSSSLLVKKVGHSEAPVSDPGAPGVTTTKNVRHITNKIAKILNNDTFETQSRQVLLYKFLASHSVWFF